MEEALVIRDTEVIGKGIFANRNFEKGEQVFVIAGGVTKTPTIYTIPISPDLFIDPKVGDTLAQHLNHSCEPNCGIKNRSVVTAMRDIKKGEHITIDYAMIVYAYDQNRLQQDISCNCGVQKCRGEFGSYIKLTDQLKEKYKGYISGYML